MPVTAWSYIAGALSISGVPPLAGFFSKLFIILGAVAAGMYWVAIVAALVSVVTLGYLLRVVNRMFRDPRQPRSEIRESPGFILVALVLLVGLTFLFGVGFKPVLQWVVGPAADVLFYGLSYARLVLGS